MTPGNGVPAGWYPDPAGSQALRWWDGTRWTEHVSQAATPTQASADPTMQWQVPVGRSGWAIAAGYAGLLR